MALPKMAEWVFDEKLVPEYTSAGVIDLEARKQFTARVMGVLRDWVSAQKLRAWQAAASDAGAPAARSIPDPRPRRGPRPDREGHITIGDVVEDVCERLQTRDWRTIEALEAIVERLDDMGIEVPSEWAEDRPYAETWQEALIHRKTPLLKHLEYRIGKAKQYKRP